MKTSTIKKISEHYSLEKQRSRSYSVTQDVKDWSARLKTENRREFSGAHGKSSIIKNKNLDKLKYLYKNAVHA